MIMIINNNNNSDNNDDADDNDDDGDEVNENSYWELHNFPVLVSESLNPNPSLNIFLQKDFKIHCSHTGSSSTN